MAKSHQRGTIRLEHHSWVGYMNIKMLDPITGESKWKKQRVGVLGAQSVTTKHQARDLLEQKIALKTGGSTQPRADERIVTLGWFTRNRFFPLREGSKWKEQTAKTKKIVIGSILLDELGDVPMAQINKFVLQMHLNRLAKQVCADSVKKARTYLKAIFEEAIDQEFMQSNPARNLVVPKELRASDKTTLDWEQLRSVLGKVEARDRVLFTLEMTWPFRPSELLAPRWKNFNYEERTLAITQTAYKGKLRDWGKTGRAIRTVILPEGLANDLWLWKQGCPDPSPEAFIFATQRKSRKTKQYTFISTDNYRKRVMKRLAEKLNLPKLNFQVLRRSIATLAQQKGSLKDVQGILGHARIETTGNVYVQELTDSVLKVVGSIYQELKKPETLQSA